MNGGDGSSSGPEELVLAIRRDPHDVHVCPTGAGCAGPRRAVAPEAAREGLVDDGHRARLRAVGGVDGTPRPDGDAHRLEVPAADRVGQERHRLARGGDVPLNLGVDLPVVEET